MSWKTHKAAPPPGLLPSLILLTFGLTALLTPTEAAANDPRAEICTGIPDGLKIRRLSVVSVLQPAARNRQARNAVADRRPKYARTGQRVFLYAVVEAMLAGKRIYFTEASRVRLGRRLVPGARLR